MKHKYTKEDYKELFFFVAEKRTIDYAINLEYEYGTDEVIAEAIKLGYGG